MRDPGPTDSCNRPNTTAINLVLLGMLIVAVGFAATLLDDVHESLREQQEVISSSMEDQEPTTSAWNENPETARLHGPNPRLHRLPFA